MNVKRLEGRQLNYWVAMSAGLKLSADPHSPDTPHDPESGVWHPHTYNPANDWSQAGLILSNEWFSIEDALIEWFGPQWPHIPAIADHPLKWFMRAYVATQYGDEVEDLPSSTSGEAFGLQPPLAPTARMQMSAKTQVGSWFQQINW